MTPDPKPRKRRKASPQEWKQLADLVTARYGRRCQLCGSTHPTVSLHHVVPRSEGGDDDAANLMPVCGHGTAGCHGRITLNDRETLARVRAALWPEQERYARERKGEAWLNRRYPR